MRRKEVDSQVGRCRGAQGPERVAHFPAVQAVIDTNGKEFQRTIICPGTYKVVTVQRLVIFDLSYFSTQDKHSTISDDSPRAVPGYLVLLNDAKLTATIERDIRPATLLASHSERFDQ